MSEVLDQMAPAWAVLVPGANDQLLSGLNDLIESIEYELTDEMADACTIRFRNVDQSLQDLRVLQAGVELSVFMGYGTTLEHVGRVKLVRPTPSFPEDGAATFAVTGYTRDRDMMSNEPTGSKDRVFAQQKWSDVVLAIAHRYGFAADVDDTPDAPSDLIQKVGLSDYDLVRGLANLSGFYLWVDGDDLGNWTLHFRDPATYDGGQEKRYVFRYAMGDMTTLLSFDPEMLAPEARTKLKVAVKDPQTGKVIEHEVEANADHAAESAYDGDQLATVDGEQRDVSAIKVYLGDFSFEAATDRRLKTAADVERWAQQWFRRTREGLIRGTGHVVGVEGLAARQVHRLEGVGLVYSGDYYFSRIKHVMGSNGYRCEFDVRKVLPG